MKNKKYKYTYGRPILTSALLAAYTLGLLGAFILASLTNGSGSCSWFSFLGPSLLWLLTAPLLLIVSIVTVWRYSRRIGYLKSHQLKIPKSYIVTLLLLPIALLSIFWIRPIAGQINDWSADSEMNTIDEFRTLARDCRVGMVGSYYNDSHHRAKDADAYILVYAVDGDELFYSYNQKEELRQIVGDVYSDRCPAQTNYGRETLGGLEEYRGSDWSEGIKTYSAPGGC